MYNAYWCPHCHDQKEMFGKEATEKLNLVECAKDGFNNKRDLCEAKGITGFPTLVAKEEYGDDQKLALISAGYQPYEQIKPVIDHWLEYGLEE